MCVNSFREVLDDSKCNHQEKLTEQRCSDVQCPQWKTGDWSDVSGILGYIVVKCKMASKAAPSTSSLDSYYYLS